MQTHWNSLNRREFVRYAGAAAGSLSASSLFGQEAKAPLAKEAQKSSSVSFFLIGDTHFLADKNSPEKLDSRSVEPTRQLVETLNRLPGSIIPDEAGGGKVNSPRGVIHAGDVTDSGDKNGSDYPKMQETEWRAFEDEYGLSGTEGNLKLPVYEVHGNHDSPGGDGMTIKKIAERNKTRPHVVNVSANGVHYSWDWGNVHFVNLGLVVGGNITDGRPRRYNPLDSLTFLADDLKTKVGDSGRPVVITHHLDMIRYSVPCDESAKLAGKEWNPCDVNAYFRAIRPYHVAAVLYGHTHARNIFRWDGSEKRANAGVPVFNVDNGSHFNNKDQAFFYFELNERELIAREYATKDRWATGSWTPQVWRVPLVKA